MPLFQLGDFTLASGDWSPFKIECDALTPEDWSALAVMAMRFLPPFREVRGVPRGGISFADALRPYADPASDRLLLAEDVVTSGGSIGRFLAATAVGSFAHVRGVCAFARGPVPSWVTAVWTLGEGK